MKLITDSNLELVIQAFYDRIVEEFSVAESADKLTTGRTLTIGNSAKTFDGTQDLFWSLTDIGIGSPSNLTTSDKSNVVNAINELNANKASIAYVEDALDNVSIEDAIIAVEVVGEIEDIEVDYVTQAELESELEEALANIGDLDIEGMVTAVDVGNVDIEQGGGNGGGVDESVIGQLSSLQTANKTNLVGAINELFQNANNGKQLIADAIGSPLNSEQTFSAMSTDINNLLSSFKTNMLNLGVTIDNNDKFQSLIEKLEAGREVTRSYDVVVRVELDGTARITYPTSLDFGFIPDEVTMVFDNGLTINYPERNYSASIVISAVSAYGISLTGNGHVPGDHGALITVTGKESIGNSNNGIKFKTGQIELGNTRTFTHYPYAGDPSTSRNFKSFKLNLDFDCNFYAVYLLTAASIHETEILYTAETHYFDLSEAEHEGKIYAWGVAYDYYYNINDGYTFNQHGWTLDYVPIIENKVINCPIMASWNNDMDNGIYDFAANEIDRSFYFAVGVGEQGDDPALLASLKSILTEEGATTSNDDTLASLITKVDNEFDRKNEINNNTYETLFNLMIDAGYFLDGTEQINDLLNTLSNSGIAFENVAQVSCGRYHTFILKTDGSLWSTGYNSDGQLGLGDTTNRTKFTKVTANINNDVKRVVCGDNHTMIIKNDNSLWGTGNNASGQLGLGDNTDRTTFVKVAEGIKQVECGHDNVGGGYTLIVTHDGALWGTGSNHDGQFGVGVRARSYNTFQKATTNLNNDVDQIFCGPVHTFLVKNDGSLWAAGNNEYGTLGLGDNTGNSDGDYYSVFTQVTTNINNGDVKKIVCAGWDSCAHTMLLKNDGSLWGTGYNGSGQLGLGSNSMTTSNADKNTFTKVTTNINNDVRDVACGDYFTHIVKKDGTVWGTGNGGDGKLGLGSMGGNKSTFTQVTTNINNDVRSLAGGYQYMYLIKTNGSVWSCGDNAYGQLGLNSYADKNTFTNTSMFVSK